MLQNLKTPGTILFLFLNFRLNYWFFTNFFSYQMMKFLFLRINIYYLFVIVYVYECCHNPFLFMISGLVMTILSLVLAMEVQSYGFLNHEDHMYVTFFTVGTTFHVNLPTRSPKNQNTVSIRAYCCLLEITGLLANLGERTALLTVFPPSQALPFPF